MLLLHALNPMLEHENSHSPSPEGKSVSRIKPLGGYLVEAGLLTPGQIDVALNDQKLTGMRFGEILAARGWVKQQTIEYLMQKVILPEKAAVRQQPPQQQAAQQQAAQPGVSKARLLAEPSVMSRLDRDSSGSRKQPPRHDAPIAKPLPSVPAADDDVSWVG